MVFAYLCIIINSGSSTNAAHKPEHTASNTENGKEKTQLSHIHTDTIMTTLHKPAVIAIAAMLSLAAALPAKAQSKPGTAEKTALAEEARNTALPFISIKTVSGEKPTFTIIEDPYGMGKNAIKAEHTPARMVMTLHGDTIYDSGDYVEKKSGIRIKVRGNTSAMLFEQTPYKLKLSKKADLLFRNDNEKNSKDWALLSVYIPNDNMEKGQGHLQTMFGLELARQAGMDWSPSQQFVNVAINGEYAGMYNLCETVERSTARVNVDDSGFVIEDDAYWWNESRYFRTERQKKDDWMGYTFKYPDEDDVTDDYLTTLSDYMSSVENTIGNNNNPERFIDFTSFARWILAHDLLASADAAGTNIYYTKHDFDAADATASPLKAGPLWDFGAIYKAPLDGWSLQHTSSLTFYPQLFKNEDFCKAYTALYDELSKTLPSDMQKALDEYQSVNGEAFDKSEKLHQRLISYDAARTFAAQKEELLRLLNNRIATVGRLIKSGMLLTGLSTHHTTTPTKSSRYDMTGRNLTNIRPTALPHGIYIERGADGKTRKICR